MPSVQTAAARRATAMAATLALIAASGCNTTQSSGPGAPTTPSAHAEAQLSLDDVSWLFPPPTAKGDLDNRIAVAKLTVPDPAHPGAQTSVWSDADFANFLAIADSQAGQVDGGTKIGLPAAVHDKSVWFVAGIRIDAGAPGLDPTTVAVYGQRPQIRLIVQPVLTDANGVPHVQDITAHLLFDYVLPEAPANLAACPLHAVPDLATFKSIVADTAALRDDLAAGKVGGVKISTAGLPLGVHPGLANTTTEPALKARMAAFLQKRLSPQRMNAMAMMGLPANTFAPWMFVAMTRVSGQFVPVPNPTLDGTQVAIELTPNGAPRVVPAPHTDNLSPISCASGASSLFRAVGLGPPVPPIASRHGVATADVFVTPNPDKATADKVLDVIVDPARSHFFNTDCVSCHTETRRAALLTGFNGSTDLSSDVVPKKDYDVRNFGWSAPAEGNQATATRRTAAETKAVVKWINDNALNK